VLTQADMNDALDQAEAVRQQRGAAVFIMLFLDAWTMVPTDVVTVASQRGSTCQFVRGDQFFDLQRAAHGLPPAD